MSTPPSPRTGAALLSRSGSEPDRVTGGRQMQALVAFVRAELRQQWRALVGLAMLIGLVGTVVLGAAAGARRTTSSLDRFREATRARDVQIQVDDEELVEPVLVAVEALDAIEASGRFSMYPVLPDEDQVAGTELDLLVFASDDGGWGRDVDRGLLLRGRRPDPDAVGEVVFNELAVETAGLDVGAQLDVATFTPDDLSYMLSGEGFRGFNGPALSLEVVGVVRSGDDLGGSVTESGPAAIATPAFVARYGNELGGFHGMLSARLADGEEDLDIVRQTVRAVAGPGGEVLIEAASEGFARGASETLAVLGNSLWIFAGMAALAGAVAVGGAVSRQVSLGATAGPVLAALGLDRRRRTLALGAPVMLAAAGGAAIAAVGAVAISPLLPIGLARRAEPDPGVAADALVLAIGATAVAVVVGAWALVSTHRAHDRGPARARSRPARPMPLLALSSRHPAAVLGLREIVARRAGTDRVPMRSAIAATVLAVGGVVGVATVNESLSTLAGDPERYGWGWSAEPDVLDGGADGLLESLAADEDIAGVAHARNATVELEGRQVDGMSISAIHGVIEAVLRDGRHPTSPTEVALGARTARDLGVGIGENIDASTSSGIATTELEVVGIAVFRPVDNPDPAQGALLTAAGLEALRRSEGFQSVLVSYHEGADRDEYEALLTGRHPIGFSVYSYPRLPGNVGNLVGTRGVVRSLGLLFAALGVAGGAHALITSGRRRRRDLAVLRSLGFLRRQTRRTVTWQGLGLGLVGLAAGVPIGLAAGRIVWRLMASDLGLIADAVNPWTLLVWISPAVVVVAAALSWWPARRAAQLLPAHVLGGE